MEANKLASEQALDLVKISPNSVPPVCRIMDYGKFRFELQKKEKEAKKNQKVIEVKEIRLQGKGSKNIAIGEHDIQFKAKNAIRFLKAGNKVKLSIMMKGRQNLQKGIDLINYFIELLSEEGQKEKEPALEGRIISAIVAPKSAKTPLKAPDASTKSAAATPQNKIN